MQDQPIDRRQFFARSLGTLGALAAGSAIAMPARAAEPTPPREPDPTSGGEQLEQIAFPMGGLGAGMMCLEGAGGLTHVSVRNTPALQNQPGFFAAISVLGPAKVARVVEGPLSKWKLFLRRHASSGSAPIGSGFPRYDQAQFRAHFPFARIELEDKALPLSARITGWSPFEPGDADSSSLPVAGLEYTFTHNGDEELEAVFSFNAHNFLAESTWDDPGPARTTRPTERGFIFYGGPSAKSGEQEAWLAVAADDADTKVNLAWFRGDWFDPQTMAWRDVEQGLAFDRPLPADGNAPTGASLFVPFRILPGQSRTIRVRLSWYSPKTALTEIAAAGARPGGTYSPWYSSRFASIDQVDAFWRDNYDDLRARSQRFSSCFFDSTLPAEAVEAIAANLSILKSPTVLRQADGKLWGWEGCDEDRAQGPGSCTHVWNYAQAIAHLFPVLERSLRETEFGVGQDERGHQNFRVALPIQATPHDGPAAADGQLGGIIKAHREWRISGDTGWLRGLWPRIKASLDYCIETWDPGHKGWIEEPHHNTYDIEFWGPDGMGASLYLGALSAAVLMAKALGEPVGPYEDLLERGARRTQSELFNGEYFIQKVEWKNLRAKVDLGAGRHPEYGGTYSPEAAQLLQKEGPKYQYGTGCLSDGVIGSWLALACGVGQVLDPEKVRSHLVAVYRHNFSRDLAAHPNPPRPTYANGHEGGLLLCTWPRGNMPSLPFVYSNEVWTGIEYQAASHMIMMGLVGEGLDIVRACRARYDGRVRNPFDEYEWGHWYARAMASYGLLQALSGARYDAVERVLHLQPPVRGDFHSFISTATGYGTVGVADGKPFLKVVAGTIDVRETRFTEAPASPAL